MVPGALLLDLDDTILDDSSAVERCWKEACRAHQSEYQIDPDDLYDAIRKRGEWYWGDPDRHRRGRLAMDVARMEVAELALRHLGIEKLGLARRLADRYARGRDAAIEPLPDAIETVRWFRERGAKLALITNGAGAPQRRKIERFNLAGFFDCILVEGEFGVGKPDERIYRRALAELDVAPGESWMAGDNLEFDVAAPQKLGLSGIWIDVRGGGVPPGRAIRPDRIIRRLSELRHE